MKRPPNGGPVGAGEGAGLDADDETRLEGKAGYVGEDGPAPGDCTGRGDLLGGAGANGDGMCACA